MLDDCFAHDKNRLTHAQAIDLLKSRMRNIAAVETVDLERASGRLIAQSVTAPRPIPGFDNSAVDGYAFCHSDHEANGGFFPLTARIAAGDLAPVELATNSAARIFTGAPVPQNTDTIVMQEDCETHEQDGIKFVIIPQGLKKGANIRLAGEDVEAGATILEPGHQLRAQDLAAIASCGEAKINVCSPLKIALVSTGDEIVRPGNKLDKGQVFDSNFAMLTGLLKNLPVELTDLGVLRDNRDEVETCLMQAAKDHQIIITSGGASKGEEDHVTKLLSEKGKRHLWQLAVKPGRPLCFGRFSGALLFGLPGNPVASFLCFLMYIRPALLVLGGGKWHEPQRYKIPAGFHFDNKKPGRREFWRGMIEADSDGNQVLNKFARDGSGLISGLQQAHGFIEIAEDVTQVKPGEPLDFIPFSELGII